MRKKIVTCSCLFCVALFTFAAIFLHIRSQPLQTLQMRGITVDIYGENNENTKQYLETINTIDDYLITYADTIIFTTNHVDEQANLPLEDRVENANALTVPAQRRIYINTNSYDSLTMIHEFFHLFDCYARDTPISEDKDFQIAVKKDVDNLSLSEYQGTSWSETFVACMIQYRYFYQRLQSQCPNVFAYLDTLVHSVQ